MLKNQKIGTIYCLLAGSCDGLTGILLLIAPLFTLKLMGISVFPTEPVYMQWIGAFVFSVGFCYLLPFLSSSVEIRNRRLHAVLEFTTFIRLVIGIFTGICLFRGLLDHGWLAVTLTDLFLASCQIVLLRKNIFTTA